jgi:hypothetical protein
MADIKLEVDFNDLKLLNDELNKSTKVVKLTAAEASKDFQKLKRSIDPVYAAAETFKEKVLIAQKAVATGAITNEEYAKSMQLISKQAQRAGVTLDKFGQVTAMSNKGMRHFELGVQQAGYQVGDFFVQVASGTNPMVAFSQQASQLAGFFAGPWGAAIGAGIAIFGALYVAFDRMGDKAGQTQKELAEAIATARIELEELQTGMDSTERGLLANLEAQRQKARELAAAHEMRRQALERVGGDAEFFSRMELGRYQEQLEVVREAIQQLEEYRDILAEIDRETARQAAQDSYDDRIKSLAEQNNLLRIQREYGENSVREQDYLISLKQQELDALKDAGLLTQAQVDAEMALVREQQQLNNQLTEAEANSQALADALERAAAAMSSLTSFGAGIDRQLQVAIAQVEALRAGQDAASAGVIAGLRIDLEAKRRAAIEAGGDPILANAEAAISSSQIDELEKQRAIAAQLREDQNSSRGGATTKTAQEYLDALMQEARYKQEVVGLTEEEARVKEIIFQATKQGIVVSEAQAQVIASVEAETRKLTEAQAAAQKQQEFYKDTLMDGMESLVTGSKSVNEAFRDMLRNMLLDIYRQKVMEPIAQAGSNFLSGLFMANGGAFNKGVQMFADGGVVNAPTAFGHSGGVGVMGEAGPEAIIPLKRGPDGKLGVAGGGNVTVVQNFSFSANGDESVKRIIAQAAPQIAQMTQKQIMDSRRRGGQMKATFS